MKHPLLTAIAAVLLVGCGEAQPPEPPDILITEAVFDGNIEAVKQHIAAGTDVNVRGGGVTPLHHAATQDHKKIAELLIAKGADVNAKFTKGPLQGWTPLDFATLSAAGNNKEIADLLRKHGGKHGTIYVAAQGGDIEAVKEFLASGTDVNVKDEDGDTPLLEASGGGHKEVVELLIAAGADVNAKSVYGITPLHYAARHDHKETIELLIANGANVNAKVLSGQQQGKTPLDAANEANHTETADLLRKHGSKTGEELKAEC